MEKPIRYPYHCSVIKGADNNDVLAYMTHLNDLTIPIIFEPYPPEGTLIRVNKEGIIRETEKEYIKNVIHKYFKMFDTAETITQYYVESPEEESNNYIGTVKCEEYTRNNGKEKLLDTQPDNFFKDILPLVDNLALFQAEGLKNDNLWYTFWSQAYGINREIDKLVENEEEEGSDCCNCPCSSKISFGILLSVLKKEAPEAI